MIQKYIRIRKTGTEKQSDLFKFRQCIQRKTGNIMHISHIPEQCTRLKSIQQFL